MTQNSQMELVIWAGPILALLTGYKMNSPTLYVLGCMGLLMALELVMHIRRKTPKALCKSLGHS